MTDGAALGVLVRLTRALEKRLPLSQTLQLAVEHCAELMQVSRASLRLFDPTRTRLLATCRSGEPLHARATAPFAVGEGLIGWIAKEVRPLRLDEPRSDPRYQPRPGMHGTMGAFLGVPVVAEGECIGVLAAVSPTPAHFTLEHEQLLQVAAGLCAPHLEVARLERLAQVDALTGALNRRGLEHAAAADGAVASVVMVDLDFFKRVNDTLGHAAGDECLRQVATLLSEVVRAQDALVRYGGEEFLLVLPGNDLMQAARVAERARETCEARTFRLAGTDYKLTLSAGVAQQREGEAREAAVARADAALYRAKQEGRNRVVVAAE